MDDAQRGRAGRGRRDGETEHPFFRRAVIARPILVTGAHRSGSTWVGRMLAEAPGVLYVHEPFSVSDPPGRGVCNVRFARWFTYVTRDSDAAYHRAFTDLVGLQYNHRAALRDARSLAEVRRVLAEGRTWSR